MSAGFCPDHKAAMVLFLDRVYGIEDQDFLLHLLEVGFLPDLRAAASLDTVRVQVCCYFISPVLLNTAVFFILQKTIFNFFMLSSAFLKCYMSCLLLLSFENAWRTVKKHSPECCLLFKRLHVYGYKKCNAFPQVTFWACAVKPKSDKLPMNHIIESLFLETYRKCSSPCIC